MAGITKEPVYGAGGTRVEPPELPLTTGPPAETALRTPLPPAAPARLCHDGGVSSQHSSTDTTPGREPLAEWPAKDRAAFRAEQEAAYADLADQGLDLDLTRGKPSPPQLDLADALLNLPAGPRDPDGVDARNYGGLQGIRGLREIFGELLGMPADQVVAGNNASLVMMRDVLVDLWLKGGVTSERPWSQEEKVTFLCPVPGYDRHFTLTDWIGIDMVTVPMHDDGPDMDEVERLVAEDPSVKGIWVVPTYSNPTGATVTSEVARRLASMPTAAPDFTIMWDNAYAFHHLSEVETPSADILALATEAGHPHRPILFASTSKITYAGAGIGLLAGSPETVAWYVGHLGKGAIGPDKLNQLRHLEFFGSAQGVREHMARHRELLAPKFAEVERVLSERLGGLGVAVWTDPLGGYFVNLDVLDGTASRVVQLAKQAGVSLTPAGSSFPYGRDPRDRNIRIAPTFPALPELTSAMEALSTCVLLAAAEKLTDDSD